MTAGASPNPADDPHWLTVVEAARLLSVSEKTIRRGVANGAILHVRPAGGRGTIRISREALESPQAGLSDRG
jgi:excisionase family DNA binding protein